MAEVKQGLSFNLSFPLDFPGGSVLNPRRSPPVLRPDGTQRQTEYELPNVVRRPLVHRCHE
jgi:hypothetical protein